jgi:hypothetical protein
MDARLRELKGVEEDVGALVPWEFCGVRLTAVTPDGEPGPAAVLRKDLPANAHSVSGRRESRIARCWRVVIYL